MKMYLASLPAQLELKGSSCGKPRRSSASSVEALIKLRDFSLSNDPSPQKQAVFNEWQRRPSFVKETLFNGAAGEESAITSFQLIGASNTAIQAEVESSQHSESEYKARETKRNNLLGKRAERPVSPQKPVASGRQSCLHAGERERSGRRSSDVECRRAKRRVLRRLREERMKEREATERCLLRMKAREEKRLEYERLVEMKEARRRQIYAKNAVYRLYFESKQEVEH